MSNESLVKAINSFDLKTLPLELVDILRKLVPTDDEIKAYRNYEKEGKSIDVLSDEDKFIYQLGRVERLVPKLNVMNFVATFEVAHTLHQQVNAIYSASNSIKNSQKFQKLLEIILAFGNYMNSHKRGVVYGFKIQSLDMLLETKTQDKKQTLLDYIHVTVRKRFPELLNVEAELRCIDKAAQVSMENITTDIDELAKGMELTRTLYNARKDSREPPIVLRDFLATGEERVKELKADAKSSQEAYQAVLQHLGENTRGVPPNTFFAMFQRFITTWKKTKEEHEARELKLLEMNNPLTQGGGARDKRGREAMVSELKKKQSQMIKEHKLLNKDEVYHGALEDILLGLKNEPYRRADAVRRSQRRRNQQLRSSRNMEEVF